MGGLERRRRLPQRNRGHRGQRDGTYLLQIDGFEILRDVYIPFEFLDNLLSQRFRCGWLAVYQKRPRGWPLEIREPLQDLSIVGMIRKLIERLDPAMDVDDL